MKKMSPVSSPFTILLILVITNNYVFLTNQFMVTASVPCPRQARRAFLFFLKKKCAYSSDAFHYYYSKVVHTQTNQRKKSSINYYYYYTINYFLFF